MATKPDVLVMVPTRPAQMEMLEESYTLHRLDKAEDKGTMLREVGPDKKKARQSGPKKACPEKPLFIADGVLFLEDQKIDRYSD